MTLPKSPVASSNSLFSSIMCYIAGIICGGTEVACAGLLASSGKRVPISIVSP